MPSTFLTYRMYAQDLTKSLVRTASKVEVAREEKYYQENIGKVTSVDDLLNDRRLFAYAMKAHGLEDMTYAKAFMRKVLESDLTDAKSFARQLVDSRYAIFANSFSFTKDGTVRSSLPYVQNEFQEDDTIGLYSEHRVKKGASAATEAQYYQSKLATLTSVDELVADDRLFAFALTAFGLDPKIASETTIRNVLTSDLSDPGSVANSLGNARYVKLANAFNFETDGSVSARLRGAVRRPAHRNGLCLLRCVRQRREPRRGGAQDAVLHQRHRQRGIGRRPAERRHALLLRAHGVRPQSHLHSKDTIRQVLTSDLTDPDSFANTLTDTRYRTLAAAFNFATDGTISGVDGAQSGAIRPTARPNSTSRYYDDAAVNAEAVATTFYRNRINLMTSVDALLDNSTLYNYVLEAYGFDPKTESKAKIRQALVSDLSNPTSFANRQSDPRYRELAAAFNFGPDGSVLQPREAQTETEEIATIQLYNTRIGTSASGRRGGHRGERLLSQHHQPRAVAGRLPGRRAPRGLRAQGLRP